MWREGRGGNLIIQEIVVERKGVHALELGLLEVGSGVQIHSSQHMHSVDSQSLQAVLGLVLVEAVVHPERIHKVIGRIHRPTPDAIRLRKARDEQHRCTLLQLQRHWHDRSS